MILRQQRLRLNCPIINISIIFFQFLFSDFEARKWWLRDFFLIAEFRFVDPRLRTSGVTKPLFPEMKMEAIGLCLLFSFIHIS